MKGKGLPMTTMTASLRDILRIRHADTFSMVPLIAYLTEYATLVRLHRLGTGGTMMFRAWTRARFDNKSRTAENREVGRPTQREQGRPGLRVQLEHTTSLRPTTALSGAKRIDPDGVVKFRTLRRGQRNANEETENGQKSAAPHHQPCIQLSQYVSSQLSLDTCIGGNPT